MNNPLVSIIIPTYNRPDYLERAVTSVLKQTYEKIEIIIIDDHSVNDLSKIINKFQDPRIKFYRNKTNRGSVYSRNRGISLCKGDYINFLDDDDELLPNKIEFQLRKFKQSKIQNLGVIVCDMAYSRRDINQVKQNHLKGQIYKKLLAQYCVYGIHSMLIKRTYCPRFDNNLTSNQEYDLAIRLAKICSFDYIPKVLAITHESEDQISFNYRKKKEGTIYLFTKYKHEFIKFGIRFYVYNWFRFRYLLFRYFITLKIGNVKINKIMHDFHNRFLKNL
jgi:glycosyltransferase involved in cell wall biosynthesis